MNNTFFPNLRTLERKWYILDATGQPLGRVAMKAAVLLRGKHKAIFSPHIDCGDHVVIINCKEAILTGRKLQEKRRYRYTGYIGNLKTINYSSLMKSAPEKAMAWAVKGMLRNCVQGRKQFLRLRTFSGKNHNHTAQNPLPLENFNFGGK